MKTPHDTHSLFAAARGERPSFAARDAMWKNLEVGLGLVPAAASSGVRVVDGAPASSPPPAPPLPAPPVVASSSSGAAVLKAGLIGGGVGSGVTAVTVLLAVHGAPSLAPPPATHVDRVVDAPRDDRPPSMLVPIAPPTAEHGTDRAPLEKAANPDDGDVLTREVGLVMSARQALLAGDATRALDLASRARGLHGQLEKEALTLEVRALRALARDAEADRTEMELKVLHPR